MREGWVTYSTTYHRNSDNWNDCGLRFEQLNEKIFRCPACETEINAVFL